MTDIPELSFFITRKINNMNDNLLWIECIRQIRLFYNNEPIYIIDDDNNIDNIIKLDTIVDIPKHNIHLLNTNDDLHIKGSGSLASFYYYHKLKSSKRAIFLKDDLFILKPFDEDTIKNSDIRLLFGFIDKHETYKSLVNSLVLNLNYGQKILEYKYNYNWVGCLNNSCLISLDYILYLDNHYNFFINLHFINNKLLSKVFERLLGLLITYDKKNLTNISLLGFNCQYNNDLNKYIYHKNELINDNIPYYHLNR